MEIKKYILGVISAMMLFTAIARTENPKREFRGAWMTTVFQEQYAKQSTEQNKKYICDQLDKMRDAGINVVLFQARPSADAFYESKYEPWSKFLSADHSKPNPFWDPLEFVVTEAHKRGMELHAWINPYRVTTSKNQVLPKGHLYHKEPERFITYEGDGKIYFDPGLPENRAFIVDVIHDIIDRYNIDAIHFDDYFYPYPVAGKDFNDDKTYKKYGKGMKRDDWRRQNVDKLIQEIHYMIANSQKPWIRFGISPFGIWRNKKSDPRGSNTNGLQNYDDLYADVILWAEKGWIDYLVPQLYWELDHKVASSRELITWWAQTVPTPCHLYIGQSVERTMKTPDAATKEKNQLKSKINLSRTTEGVMGNCWFPCYDLTADKYGIASALKKGEQSTIALVPAYPNLSDQRPEKVSKLKIKNGKLTWKGGKIKGKISDPVKYVIYRFDNDKRIDINDSRNIFAVTGENYLPIESAGVYVVTALDRVNNESEPSDKIVIK